MSYTLNLKTIFCWERQHVICCLTWKKKIKQLSAKREVDEAKVLFMKALEGLEHDKNFYPFYMFPDDASTIAKLYNLQEDDVLNAKDVRW